MFQIHSKQVWLSKIMKTLGFNFTEEKIDNAIDGLIGERMGIKCYVTKLIECNKK